MPGCPKGGVNRLDEIKELSFPCRRSSSAEPLHHRPDPPRRSYSYASFFLEAKRSLILILPSAREAGGVFVFESQFIRFFLFLDPLLALSLLLSDVLIFFFFKISFPFVGPFLGLVSRNLVFGWVGSCFRFIAFSRS